MFDFVDYDLEKDLKKRIKYQTFYEESELWNIVACTIAGLSYLSSKGFNHGDIRPSNILLVRKDKCEAKVKIMPNTIVFSK